MVRQGCLVSTPGRLVQAIQGLLVRQRRQGASPGGPVLAPLGRMPYEGKGKKGMEGREGRKEGMEERKKEGQETTEWKEWKAGEDGAEGT